MKDERNAENGSNQLPGVSSFNTEYLHHDHLGSTRLVTDEAGLVLSEHKYYPFGHEATPIASHDPRMKYTGHERDESVDLDYMFARYYGATAGRFLSVDPSPLSVVGTNPATWNRFAYARNNPVNRFDPDGRKDEYAKHKATMEAIVDTFHRYHAQTGKKVETGTAAYETSDGESKLVAGEPGSHPDSVASAGPAYPAGEAEIKAGNKFRGEAHMHPSGKGQPSPPDANVWLANNRAIGIEPQHDPDAAVDMYIVSPDGDVYQLAYGVPGEFVTTVEALEAKLKDDKEGEEKAPDEEPDPPQQ